MACRIDYFLQPRLSFSGTKRPALVPVGAGAVTLCVAKFRVVQLEFTSSGVFLVVTQLCGLARGLVLLQFSVPRTPSRDSKASEPNGQSSLSPLETHSVSNRRSGCRGALRGQPCGLRRHRRPRDIITPLLYPQRSSGLIFLQEVGTGEIQSTTTAKAQSWCLHRQSSFLATRQTHPSRAGLDPGGQNP